MRSMWTGTLSFGLVVIPVRLGPAVSEGRLPLHEVRRGDGSRVSYKRVAVADGKEVPYDQVVKGFETPAGQTVLLERADFDAAYGEKNRNARILTFTDAGQLPRRAHEATYLVQPGTGGERSYALLARVMSATGKAAVVSIAVRQREALALLHATGDGYLLLERLHWAASVAQPDFAAPHADVTDTEVKVAENLIAQLTQEFDWSTHADTSMQRLQAVIDAKVATGQVTGTPSPKAPGATTAPADLMTALAASVAEIKAAKAPARKPRSRKAPATRQPEAA